MAGSTRFNKTSTTAATAQILTWSSNQPAISYSYTIAQGDIITSTETGICIATMNTQITAMLLEIAALKTAMNDGL